MGSAAPCGHTFHELTPLTTLHRRLSAEWELLLALVQRNPHRLTTPTGSDTTFRVTLHGSPSTPVHHRAGPQLTSHTIRIHFPVHFPAVPMELYLDIPVLHPNVHPETGFVCLWERHRVSNTVEHALHKTVAMLNGTLYNLHPLHVMQPGALPFLPPSPSAGDLLLGVDYTAPWLDHLPAFNGRKSRLS